MDTHVWLWMLAAPGRLNDSARAAIANPKNEALLSVASAWEAAIKHTLGKLPLNSPPSRLVDVSIQEFGMLVLPIALDHVLVAANLPQHHKDPFDRILVAQAQVDGSTLATADPALRQYGGALMWAT
ncbi:MAG TPA: type II toxin-antitoxin system VapC family toxin [Kofleriaceae bacterium]|nr:type II toxin-antitoxin system VapC family toxin [Kofleriaceae bacterium]